MQEGAIRNNQILKLAEATILSY